jgi:acetoin utilization protein AcuB
MKQAVHKISVEEFTTPCPITVSPEASLGTVSQLMTRHGIRHIPIVSGTDPIGIISDRDIRVLNQFPLWESFNVAKVMVSNPFTVTYDAKIDSVAYEMSKRKIGSAVVMDEVGQIMGIFTSTDALNALVEVVRGEV